MNKVSETTPPTTLLISYTALKNNIKVYRDSLNPATKIMLMIKAEGYGNGDTELAKYLDDNKLVDYLGVAYVNEGIKLREEGITLPIMVMNTGVLDLEEVLSYNLEPTIYNPDQLSQLIKLNPNDIRRIKVHIKINTGMNRLGFSHKEIGPAALSLVEYGVEVVGAYTHLASSPEDYHDDFTIEQITSFNRGYELLSEKLGYNPMRHILNSAGILRFPSYQYEMVRAGMGVYGIDPSKTQEEKFVQISKWVTKISQINTLNKGETVGYVRKGKIEKDGTRIAVISIGYADGYNRLWSNGNAQVYINGAYAPTIGNVCMDMTFVDVTDINCKVGDEVELMGEHINIQDLAQAAETIDYEVMTNIGNRVERKYF
jgi:alanine racemase